MAKVVSKLEGDIRSAGAWFVAKYSGVIIENKFELKENKSSKDAFIEQVYRVDGRDKDLSGTRVRVNALIRIKDSNNIMNALEYVINSDKVMKKDPEAIVVARETILRYTES